MPRFLPLLLAVLAVFYGGYWFFGRAEIEQAARDALDRPGIRYDSVETIGFPSRFDTTVEGIEVETADGRIRWTAPFFQLFTLSYSPNRVIAVWPDRQSLRVGNTTVDIAADRMRASAQLGVSASVPLRQATLETEGLRLTGSDGASGSITRALFAIRESGGEASGNRYDIFGEVTGLTRDPSADYSDDPAAIRLEGAMTLDAPIDRHMTGIAPRRIEMRDATIRWGGLVVTGRGEILSARGGALTGSLEVDVSDAAELPLALESLGLISAEEAATLGRALAPVTGADGSVTLPVELRGNSLRVAGIPIALPALP